MDWDSLISRAEGQSIAEQHWTQAGVHVTSVRVSAASQAGFMGDYAHVTMQARLPGGLDGELKLFAKTSPLSRPAQMEYVEACQSYVKEGGFYTKIIPCLRKYHQDAKEKRGAGDVKGLWAPYCYLARQDVLVMEDLARCGFRLTNCRELMDFDHCSAVLAELARFHAATVIFEEKESEVLGRQCRMDQMFPELFESVIGSTVEGDESVGWLPAGIRALQDLLQDLPQYQGDQEVCRRAREGLPAACRVLTAPPSAPGERRVVCHGDLWSNNMLFRLAASGRSQDVRFVDFQLVRYAQPAGDVVLFLYLATDREFREKHFDGLVDVYVQEVSRSLRVHGLRAQAAAAAAGLRGACARQRPVGRAAAALFLQVTLMPRERTDRLLAQPDAFGRFFLRDRAADVRACFREDPTYRRRMTEVLAELVDTDVLEAK